MNTENMLRVLSVLFPVKYDHILMKITVNTAAAGRLESLHPN